MSRHQAAILSFYGFRAFKPHGRAVLGAEITRLVQSHLKPKLIFSRALDVLVREKVEVPGYFPLAALILSAINQHNRRLTSTVEALLTPGTRALLDTLMRQESADEAAAGSNAAYKLTLMKKLSQSTKPAKVKERVADLQLVEARYRLLKPVLDHLTLGQDGIQYYAYGVIKAQIFQLTRRAERERYLHLIAFIAHQYYRLHDNLVDVLLSSLQSFHNSALREHKDQCYVRREHRNESLKMLVGFLDHGVLETLAQLSAVAKNSELTDSEKVQRICALLTDNQVTQSLAPEQLAELKATLVTELSEEDYYLILPSKSVRLQNRVSQILKAVTFLAEPGAKDLHRAMEHFRLKDGAIDKTAPVDFLTPDDRTAVSRDGRFIFSSRRRHTISLCDWSSDVCSSDLQRALDKFPVCVIDLVQRAFIRLIECRWQFVQSTLDTSWEAFAKIVQLTINPSEPTRDISRSEERRVGKECRSRWSPYH